MAEHLREQSADYAFLAAFEYLSDRVVFHLRSIQDGFDVSAIAQSNGGGHRVAAGFSVSASSVRSTTSPERMILSAYEFFDRSK